MRKLMMTASMVCLTAAALAGAASAQNVDTAGWKPLGELGIDWRGKARLIVVNDPAPVTRIMLVVEEAPMLLKQIKVTFGNGQVATMKTNAMFNEGQRSSAIDLPGEARSIRTVQLNYRNLARNARANVKLFGKGPAPVVVPPPVVVTPPVVVPPPVNDAPAGWERLGEVRVAEGKLRSDVIKVGRWDGRYRRLMIEVQGADLVIEDIVVRFGNGETFTPSADNPRPLYTFHQNVHSAELAMPGELRWIDTVTVNYRGIAGGGKAKVVLYGQAEKNWNRAGWTLLGDAIVDGRRDLDTLTIGKQAGKYRTAMVLVEGSDVILRDILIEFGNGEKFSPPTQLSFRQDFRTRGIDFPGDARFIKKVTFKTGNLPGGGKARILFFAK